MMDDIIIIGSGMNSLVCAALLARKGKKVRVLERNTVAGGCIRTEELTVPGFRHDTLSTLYPLFVTAPHYPQLKDELAAHGAEIISGPLPTAVVLPDGRSLIFSTDRAANAARLDALAAGDGAAYVRAMGDIEREAQITFGLLGNPLWSWPVLKLLAGQLFRRGPRALAAFFGSAMQSSRSWISQSFKADLSRALFAPWILHVGLSPESTLSGHMGKLIMFTLEQVGSPMVKGGSARIVEAFTRLIEARGGSVEVNADVAEIIVANGAAQGVRLADGRELSAREAVIGNVTPTQLYGRLLAKSTSVPDPIRQQAADYRYGRGEMQIHLALSVPPNWSDPALQGVGMLHLTPGLDGVSRAVNEAERGLLPAEATIVVAQPMAIDPSRGPAGSWIFWIQLQELPREIAGDAAGKIATPADGKWTPAVREAYADRIIDRLEALIPGLKASILGRHVISPADLEALNINLVGGDPYSGDCSIDQFMLWRPFAAANNHATPIKRLFHIGASTHPGPGLGGMSGFMVANALS
jgi:phytoene dehydrogenase-like protein